MARKKSTDASLGDQNTFQGQAKPKMEDRETRSLGDQVTFAGHADDGGFDDDGMEIVDLAARYKIEKTLGKGGMGEVLLATDKRLDRKVAIKRILGHAARSKTAVNRFLTEAKSIAALNHHNIVQIYDYGREKDGPFLIMEYVDGGSLLDKCRKGALPVEEAIELACQLCDGLAKAHDAGIVHRDIKPANALLTSDGIPKLTDFGLAKDAAADSGMTMSGAVLGTLDFMPPEQRRDLSLTDARSDLWSLAATLYQMLTGKSPKIIKFNDVPKALHDVLGKALEDEREDRYQTAGEFRDALRGCLKAGEPTPEMAVDLGAGECAQCHTKNESSRKFCRECAATLRVKCLNCDAEIPVWEKVCAECGSKQQELIDQLRAEMAATQAKAVQLLASYDFAGANRIACTLRDEPDPRFQHLKGWSEKFLGEIEREHAKQLGRNATLLQESLKHEAAYDYQAGINNLLRVPEVLRAESIPQQSLTVAELLGRLRKKQTESQRLEKLIRGRLAAKQLDNLQPEVEALLKLRPDLKDMAELRDQLVERERKLRQTRDECFAAGKELFAAQDYAGCLSELSKIDSVYSDDAAVRALREQATNAQDRLSVLRKSIAAGVEQKKLQGLLGQVEELLSLHSADEGMQNLHEKLVVREARNAATIREIIERARLLRGKCRFADAVTELQRIPGELRTGEANEMLEDCSQLAEQRSFSMAYLRKAIQTGDYAQDSQSPVSVYRDSLRTIGLEDRGFSTLQQTLLSQHEADRGLRSLLTTVSIAAVTLLLLMLIGVLFQGIITPPRMGTLTDRIRQAGRESSEPSVEVAGFGQIGEREQAIIDRRRKSTPAGSLRQRLADLKAYSEIEARKQQRAYAEQAPQEIAGHVKEMLSNLGHRNEVLGILRQMTPEQREEALRLAPGVGQEIGDDRVDVFARCVAAFSRGVTHGWVNPIMELVGIGGTEKEIQFIRQLDEIATREFHPYRPGDPWSERVPLQAIEMLPWVFVIGGLIFIAYRWKAVFLLSQQQKAAGDRRLRSLLTKVDIGAITLILLVTIGVSAGLWIKSTSERRVAAERLAAEQQRIAESFAKPIIKNSIGMQLTRIPSGTFTMGAGSEAHQVSLTQPFFLGIHEVTQSQYEKVMGVNPSNYKGENNPVEQVSWDEAVEFCRRLSGLPAEMAARRIYRLPTEAEWEYSCRAGTTTDFSFGDNGSELGVYAWHDKNSGGRTHPVGQKKPNSWGLYDMHGNVWEWCQDWYGASISGTVSDPSGPTTGSYRVNRGGSWSSAAAVCRSAYRSTDAPSNRYSYSGLRLALSPSTQVRAEKVQVAEPSGVGTEGATAEQRPELP